MMNILKPAAFNLLRKSLYQFLGLKLVVCYLLCLGVFQWRGLSKDDALLVIMTATPLYGTPVLTFFFGIMCDIKNKIYWAINYAFVLVAMNCFIWMLPFPSNLKQVSVFQWVAATIISLNMFFSMQSIVRKGQTSAKDICTSNKLATKE